MKLTLYSFPNDIEAVKIRNFLKENSLSFEEIVVNNEEKTRGAQRTKQALLNSISFLKITRSHSISIITGFQRFLFDQLLEHIKKYNPKIEI